MSISQKMNSWQTVVTNACSQPGLTRLQKALDESWTGGEEGGMLFLSLSDRAGGFTGWLTDRLEEGLVQAWRLAAGSVRVRKMARRGLMCHPQRGRLRRCFAASLATSPQAESIYNSHTMRRRLRKAGCYWCKESGKSLSLTHTHTLNNKQWHWANTGLWYEQRKIHLSHFLIFNSWNKNIHFL